MTHTNYQAPIDLLKGKVILITGSGDGIGRAVALDCAKHGATVILLGKTVKKLEKVYDLIVSQNFPTPAIIPMNLMNATPDDFLECMKTIENEFRIQSTMSYQKK